MRIALSAAILCAALVGAAHAQQMQQMQMQQSQVDWTKVDEAFGRKAAAVGGDVHRYGFPRSDLSVTLDGVTIKPSLALGGWVAMKPAHDGVMAMGDIVLLETEINPVMAKLIAAGLDITAVHNHLLRASPATFYMHISGHGDAVKLATAIKDALGASKTPLGPPAAPAQQPAIDLDTAQLDQIIGAKGNPNGGVYAFGIPRRDKITEEGMTLCGSRSFAEKAASRLRGATVSGRDRLARASALSLDAAVSRCGAWNGSRVGGSLSWTDMHWPI